MSSLRCFTWGVLCILISNVYSTEIVSFDVKGFGIKLKSCERGLNLYLITNGVEKRVGFFDESLNQKYYKTITRDAINLRFENTELTLSPKVINGVETVNIYWKGSNQRRLQNCYDHGHAQWFGGPQQKRQYWPIQGIVFKEYSYVTKEADNAAIMEPYWLSSDGFFVYIHKNSPLFVDQNYITKYGVCFIAEIKPPYSLKRRYVELNLTIGRTPSPRSTHEHVVAHFLGKPSTIPDYRMIEHPIWSTWAKYKTLINESIVLEFANDILKYGFNNSQLEIDDLWETCYGSFNVDVQKFPDLKRLNNKLKEMGFRVTMWIHPFINKDCDPWYTEALQKGYFVTNEQGSVDTSWWNSKGPTAAYIDFTNANASKWWYDRLVSLKEKYDVDSFKFDAGESSWSPQIPIQTGDVDEQPSLITRNYVETCAKFGPIVEVRTGQRTQDLPIFIRMIDKDTEWTFENGLPTLITTLLQMNMNGYPFVLPDMIGGNGYNAPPSKELFIRWLQANTFMPSLQFSYVPWDFDNETVEISKKFTDLHAQYAYLIRSVFNTAVKTGAPPNPPVWWVDPLNFATYSIWDQYLLGEYVLVAPVLEEGARSRNIYLPAGNWLAEGDPMRNYTGNQLLRNYQAPLDTLPYFIKVNG